jgi:hypothetical protein
MLTTPTKEPSENSFSINSDPITNENRKKNTIINKSSLSSHQTINGSLSRLSPDLLSDGDGGGTNDADSIISIDSIKSNTAVSKFRLYSFDLCINIYLSFFFRYACS